MQTTSAVVVKNPILAPVVPYLHVDEQLWLAIKGIAATTSYELTALGFVEKLAAGKGFYMYDMMFPPQKNRHASTEVKEAELNKRIHELIVEDVHEVDDLKCWMHSHGDYAVSWSKTDEANIRRLIASRKENWLISIVFNKAGDYKARLDVLNSALNSSILCQGDKELLTFHNLRVVLNTRPLTDEEKKICKETYRERATETTFVSTRGGSSYRPGGQHQTSLPYGGGGWEGYEDWWEGYVPDPSGWESRRALGGAKADPPDKGITTNAAGDVIEMDPDYTKEFNTYADTLLYNIDPTDIVKIHCTYPHTKIYDLNVLTEYGLEMGLDDDAIGNLIGLYLQGNRIESLISEDDVRDMRVAASKGLPALISEAKDALKAHKPPVTETYLKQIIDMVMEKHLKEPVEIRSFLNPHDFYAFTRATLVGLVSKNMFKTYAMDVLRGDKYIDSLLRGKTVAEDFRMCSITDPLFETIVETITANSRDSANQKTGNKAT